MQLIFITSIGIAIFFQNIMNNFIGILLSIIASIIGGVFFDKGD